MPGSRYSLLVAYLLLIRVGKFDVKSWRNVAVFAAGFAARVRVTRRRR